MEDGTGLCGQLWGGVSEVGLGREDVGEDRRREMRMPAGCYTEGREGKGREGEGREGESREARKGGETRRFSSVKLSKMKDGLKSFCEERVRD